MKALCGPTGIAFREAGEHELKGLPGSWALALLDGDPGELEEGQETAARPELNLTDRAMVRFARRLPAVARTLGRAARPAGIGAN